MNPRFAVPVEHFEAALGYLSTSSDSPLSEEQLEQLKRMRLWWSGVGPVGWLREDCIAVVRAAAENGIARVCKG